MSWQLFREAFFTQIRHPTTIAAFASVSLHAVVGVALPTLPYFAPEVEVGMGEGRPQNVQVIELSQAELGRLPDLSPPPIADLPDFPTNLPDATVTIPPSSSPETTTDLPPNLPPRPDTRISGSSPNDAYPYPTVEPSPNLPPRPDRSRTVIRPSAPRRSVGQTTRRLPPQTSTPSPQNRTPSIFGIDKTNRFELENPDNPADLLPRLPEDTRIGVASPTLQREREERETPDADPSPISDSDNRPLLSEEELLARRTAEEEVLPLQEDLRRRDEDTSPEEVVENERRWLANQRQAETRSRSITGNYPKDACLRKLSGRVMYGAIAQPNGGLGNIRRLQSSGYRIFDRQARSQIQGLSFSVEQPTPYRITVNFNYNQDNCPTTLSVPNPPSPSPTPSNPQPQNQQQEDPEQPQNQQQEDPEQPQNQQQEDPEQPQNQQQEDPEQPQNQQQEDPEQPQNQQQEDPEQPQPSPSPTRATPTPSQPSPSPSDSPSPSASPSPTPSPEEENEETSPSESEESVGF